MKCEVCKCEATMLKPYDNKYFGDPRCKDVILWVCRKCPYNFGRMLDAAFARADWEKTKKEAGEI